MNQLTTHQEKHTMVTMKATSSIMATGLQEFLYSAGIVSFRLLLSNLKTSLNRDLLSLWSTHPPTLEYKEVSLDETNSTAELVLVANTSNLHYKNITISTITALIQWLVILKYRYNTCAFRILEQFRKIPNDNASNFNKYITKDLMRILDELLLIINVIDLHLNEFNSANIFAWFLFVGSRFI